MSNDLTLKKEGGILLLLLVPRYLLASPHVVDGKDTMHGARWPNDYYTGF